MADSFQGGTFDPIESEDYVAPLQTGYKQINQGMNNYWNQEVSSYNQAAKAAGKNMEALADMSATIGGVLAKREADKREVDFAKGHLWFHENGVDDLEMAAFNAAEVELDAEGQEINKIRFDAEQNGASIWESLEFKKLNKAEQKGAVVAFVESRAQQYDPANSNDLKNATSYEEYKSAEAKLKLDFYKGLGDINPTLVYKYANQTVQNKGQSAYNKWNTKRDAEIREQELVDANKGLETCIKSANDGVNCLINYSTTHGHLHGGLGAGRRAGLAHAATLVEAGVLEEEQVDKMLDQTFTRKDTGKTDTFRNAYAKETSLIEDALIARANQEYKLKQAKYKLDAVADTDDFLSGLDPNQITDMGYKKETIAQLKQKKIEQQLKYGGNYDPRIDSAIAGLDLDKNTIAKYKEKAMDMFKEGTLDSETLKTLPIEVQLDTDIQKRAKMGDTVIEGAKTYNKNIEGFIKADANLSAQSYDGSNASRLAEHFQAKWRARVVQLMTQDPEGNLGDPKEIAYKELEQEFAQDKLKDPEKRLYKDGKNRYTWPGEISVDDTKNALSDASIYNHQQYVEKLGLNALDAPALFFSKKELIDMQNKFATDQKATWNPKVKNLAKLYDGLNEIDIVNKQRIALDMEPLESDAWSAYQSLPSESQFLINHSGTNFSNARAWGTAGKEVPEIHKEGKKLTELAQSFNQDFPSLAAGYDMAEMLDGEPFDADNELHILEFARSKWKYSGGTDLASLELTRRPKFRGSAFDKKVQINYG